MIRDYTCVLPSFCAARLTVITPIVLTCSTFRSARDSLLFAHDTNNHKFIVENHVLLRPILLIFVHDVICLDTFHNHDRHVDDLGCAALHCGCSISLPICTAPSLVPSFGSCPTKGSELCVPIPLF